MTEHERKLIAADIADEFEKRHLVCKLGLTREHADALRGIADATIATKKIAGHTAVATIVLAFIAVFILGFKQKILSWF